ncbi:hypothetical protein PS15p_205064 [Mucor circinelloides]
MSSVINATPLQAVDDTAPTQLHSLSSRPLYEWTPSEAQVNNMHMDIPSHTSRPMSNVDLKAIIEAYPPMAQLEYRPPATVPSAEKNMNKGQKIEDNSLKHLQYHVSAILCPLDVFAHEMLTQETNNAPNMERFCAMLADMRSLVVDRCSTITQARINIAYRTVDPSFLVKTEPNVGYYIVHLLDGFQQSITQQAAAKKALRKASTFHRPRRGYPNGNFGSGTFSSGPSQQFFRSGSPSQQGGLNNNNTNSFSNNFCQQHNNTKKSSNNNPFLSTTSATTTNPAVGGRLSKFHQQWWTTITTTNKFVNNNIIQQHSYNIHFYTPPPTTSSPVPIIPYSAEQALLLINQQAINDLLTKLAIEKASPQQILATPDFYSSMFVIPKKNGGVRPVFNLKRLNQYLDDAPHFKMETIMEVAQM